MKKCYSCGAEVPDESKFCPKCGKPIAVTRDLIDRAKADDADAQTELYERTYKTVYSRIRAKVPDADTVMDIMQETYQHAFACLDQLQNPETFPSWLLSIASRQVCDWYLKSGKENENVQMSRPEDGNDDTFSDEDDLPEEPEYREDFSPDESPDKAETGRLLSEILDTLPEDQRVILVMRYYDDLSPEEISKELDLNLSTVKARLAAARKKVEAKVRELEQSGTNLYSLSPISYLVFLLHHAEQFAPDIPADKIINLKAAGTAGTGGAAASAAADTAAKATAASGSKGISAKMVAIIAAAVVVVGGGITAAVLLSQPSETAGTETSETAPAASVKITPDATPSEEDEAEPEPSEESDGSEVSEEPSDENQDQQTEEPAETEENNEVSETVIQPPSEDTIHAMVDPYAHWFIWTSDSPGKVITPTLNQAAELAACAYYWENDGCWGNFDSDADPVCWSYILPEAGISESLKNRFGPGYDLSAFTNTASTNGTGLSGSGLDSALSPVTNGLCMMLCRENGQYKYTLLASDGMISPGDIVITGVNKNEQDDTRYTATVEYWAYYYSGGTYDPDTGDIVGATRVDESLTIEFELAHEESSAYGWVITQIAYK